MKKPKDRGVCNNCIRMSKLGICSFFRTIMLYKSACDKHVTVGKEIKTLKLCPMANDCTEPRCSHNVLHFEADSCTSPCDGSNEDSTLAIVCCRDAVAQRAATTLEHPPVVIPVTKLCEGSVCTVKSGCKGCGIELALDEKDVDADGL